MTHVEYALVSNAGWADFHAMHENPATADLHFSHTPYRDCQPYKFSRDCGEDGSGECIVKAIADFAQIASDYSKSEIERANAIRFLVHLLADIHNPMHVGFAEDLGGNRIELFLPDGTESTLHHVWDDHVLVDTHFDEVHIEVESSDLIIPDIDALAPAFAEYIASETATTLTCEHAYWNGSQWIRSGDTLTVEYMESRSRLARTQIAKSGVRLAQILEAVASEYYRQEAAAESERMSQAVIKDRERVSIQSNQYELLGSVGLGVDPEDLVYEVEDVMAFPVRDGEDSGSEEPATGSSRLAATTAFPDEEFESDEILSAISPKEKRKAANRKKRQRRAGKTRIEKAREEEYIRQLVLIKRDHAYIIVSKASLKSDQWAPALTMPLSFTFEGRIIAGFVDVDVLSTIPGRTDDYKYAQIISQITNESLEVVLSRMIDSDSGKKTDPIIDVLKALEENKAARIEIGVTNNLPVTATMGAKALVRKNTVVSNRKESPGIKHFRRKLDQMIIVAIGETVLFSTVELMDRDQCENVFEVTIFYTMNEDQPFLIFDSRFLDWSISSAEAVEIAHLTSQEKISIAAVERVTECIKISSHPLLVACKAFFDVVEAHMRYRDKIDLTSQKCGDLLQGINEVVEKEESQHGRITTKLQFVLRPRSQRLRRKP
jgi:hypothetical protein